MLFYVAVYLFIFIIAFVNTINKNRKSLVFFLLVFLLICHDGLRWETGTDWDNYFNAFNRCLTHPLENFEVGYVSMMKLLRVFTDEYTIFLLFHAFLVYILIAFTIWKYSPIPTLSLLFLYAFMLPLLGMNRQYLSLAICIYSVYFIFQRKFVPFFLCIILSFLFHKSSLLFLFAYFLNKEYSIKTYQIWILAAIVISFSGIIHFIPTDLLFLAFPEEYSSYVSVVDISIPSKILGIIRKLLWVILALYLLKNDLKPRGFSLFFNLYFVAIIGYLLLNGTLLQIIVARGLIYYSVFEIFLLTYIVSFISKQANQKAYILLIGIYYIVLLYKNISFYTIGNYNCFIPYQFCF